MTDDIKDEILTSATGVEEGGNPNKKRRNRNRRKQKTETSPESAPEDVAATNETTEVARPKPNARDGKKQNGNRRRNRNAKKGGGAGPDSNNTETLVEPGATQATTIGEDNAKDESKKNEKKGIPRKRTNNRRGKQKNASANTVEGGGANDGHQETEASENSARPSGTMTDAVEKRRVKRRNQRLRKKENVAPNSIITPGGTENTSEGGQIGPGAAASATAATEAAAGPPSTGARKGGKNKKKGGRKTESLDPASMMVRPSLRVHVAPGGSTKDYIRPLKHDDVVVVPEMFGKEDDLTIYDRLVEEINALQNEGVSDTEWTSWHQGSHMIAKDASGSKTYQEIVDRLCEYFHVKKETAFSRFNWYKDSKDWKPFHHDSAAFNKERAKKQNVTVGVSFGACRELAFLKTKSIEEETGNEDATLVYFPQPNNTCITFGRDVNINFQHGINALPESEHDGKGRVSIIVWGWTDNVIEEEGSPTLVGDKSKVPQAAAMDTPTVERKNARNNRRKKNRKSQQLQKREEQKESSSTKQSADKE